MDMHLLSRVSLRLPHTMTPSPHHPDTSAHILTYTIGFGVSIVLTLLSFWVAPSLGSLAHATIVSLAIVQLFVQLIFFLHLGSERGGHFNVALFAFAVGIIGILIIGTLWIMSNLAHLHMHTPSGAELYEHGVIAPQNELH